MFSFYSRSWFCKLPFAGPARLWQKKKISSYHRIIICYFFNKVLKELLTAKEAKESIDAMKYNWLRLIFIKVIMENPRIILLFLLIYISYSCDNEPDNGIDSSCFQIDNNDRNKYTIDRKWEFLGFFHQDTYQESCKPETLD